MTPERLRDLVSEALGLVSGFRTETLLSRLRGEGAEALAKRLRSPRESERRAALGRLAAAVTISETSFLRDPEQLDCAMDALPVGRGLQVWCAGVSTGEEAYSVALLAEERGLDLRVLGTDANPAVLEHARRGDFTEWSLRRLSPARRNRFFEKSESCFRISRVLRDRVHFESHNLLEPMPRTFDVVLCRNVMIYFSSAAMSRVMQSLRASLAPQGLLFLGASESAIGQPGLVPVRVGGRVGYAHASTEGSRREWEETQAPAPPPPKRARSDVRATLDEGYTLLREHALDDARRVFREIQLRDPFCGEAHFAEGVACRKAQEHDVAIECFRRALFTEPELWAADCLAAASFESLGLAEAAERHYRRAERAIEDGVELSLRVDSVGFPTSRGEMLNWCRSGIARVSRSNTP